MLARKLEEIHENKSDALLDNEFGQTYRTLLEPNYTVRDELAPLRVGQT